MEPGNLELEGYEVRSSLREDQDLLSHDAQASIQRLADPMGLFLAIALVVAAFLRGGGVARGLAAGGSGLLFAARTRFAHRATGLHFAWASQTGLRGGFVDDIREVYVVQEGGDV